MKNPFHGLGVALVTPFKADKSVDFTALKNLVSTLLADKVDFLCILGTTAETPCLSEKEKQEIVHEIVRQVDGKIPLLLGCGSNHTAAVTEYLQTADLEGIDGVLVVTPYYNKPSQEGLYQHFHTIANATEKPVVLYNVPGRTGVNMQAETTLRIAHDCPNVVAIKEASGNIAQIEQIISGAPTDFEVLSGDDAVTFELLAVGAVGVISVIGNACPKTFGQMVHAALNGDFPKALALHRQFQPLYPLMTRDGNPSGIKAFLSELGLIGNHLRLPLVPVCSNTQQQIAALCPSFHISK